MEPAAYRDESDIWCAQNPAHIYRAYIQDRLQRYDPEKDHHGKAFNR
jgi:hypothetical protein